MKIGKIAERRRHELGRDAERQLGFADEYIDPNLPAGDGAGQLDDPANLGPLPAGDYVVKVDIPKDANGKDIYKVTKEEDINVFGGDSFQQPKPNILKYGCAGANHLVDVAGMGNDGPNAVDNPSFVAAGGSPYEGLEKPLCDAKLIHLANGKLRRPELRALQRRAAADHPLRPDHRRPQHVSRQRGDLLRRQGAREADADLLVRLLRPAHPPERHRPERVLRGDAAVDEPDQLPEPGRCLAGLVHAGRERPVDGRPDRRPIRAPADLNPRPVVPNPDFDPQYRSISTPFETMPGHTTITDLAVWTIGVAVNGPGAQLSHPAKCLLDATATPQLFAADRVYATRPTNVSTWSNADRTFTLQRHRFRCLRGGHARQNEDGVRNGNGAVPVDGARADDHLVVGEHHHVPDPEHARCPARTRST